MSKADEEFVKKVQDAYSFTRATLDPIFHKALMDNGRADMIPTEAFTFMGVEVPLMSDEYRLLKKWLLDEALAASWASDEPIDFERWIPERVAYAMPRLMKAKASVTHRITAIDRESKTVTLERLPDGR